MKKTVSLIIAIFLLLSSCGKIRELMNPTSGTSAQAKAAEAAAKAAIEPEIKTPSESEKKSEETKEITAKSETESKETTEKQEEENEEETTVESSKLSRFGWWAAKKTVQVAAVAVVAYGLYKLWNRVMNPKPIEEKKEETVQGQQADNNVEPPKENEEETVYNEVESIPPSNTQQNEAINQQVNDDDSSEDSYSEVDRMRVFRGEGRDLSIMNEKIALDAEARGDDSPPVVCMDWEAEEGKAIRLISKFGRFVKIKNEARYRAHWEKYKRARYPNHKFD